MCSLALHLDDGDADVDPEDAVHDGIVTWCFVIPIWLCLFTWACSWWWARWRWGGRARGAASRSPAQTWSRKICVRTENIRTASSGEYKSINPISSSAVSLSSVYTQHLLSSWEWIKTSRGMCAYFKILDQDVVVVGHITKYVSKYHQAITIPLVLEMFM